MGVLVHCWEKRKIVLPTTEEDGLVDSQDSAVILLIMVSLEMQP